MYYLNQDYFLSLFDLQPGKQFGRFFTAQFTRHLNDCKSRLLQNAEDRVAHNLHVPTPAFSPRRKAKNVLTYYVNALSPLRLRCSLTPNTYLFPGGFPYTCNICFRGYKHRVSLISHKKVHQGMTKCPRCEKVCCTVKDLRKHLENVHSMTQEEVRGIVPTKPKCSSLIAPPPAMYFPGGQYPGGQWRFWRQVAMQCLTQKQRPTYGLRATQRLALSKPWFNKNHTYITQSCATREVFCHSEG